MTDKWKFFLEEFHKFVQEKKWQIVDEKDIDFGCQIIITDGIVRLPVNLFHSGKITPQGKPSETRAAIIEWANLIQSGVMAVPATTESIHQNRISKYFVLSENFENIRQIVLGLPGEITEKAVTGPADVYRVENRFEGNRVTISQYDSGTLMVQGLSSSLFDNVCEVLDQHLTQSLAERASRFLSGDNERSAVTVYLEQPDAENESTKWLLQNIDKKVLDFLYDNDRRTLLAASVVRNTFERSKVSLPDYSVVVMPFAKPYEGFLMKLAIHLGLTSEEILAKKANEIEVATWILQIKERISDKKRYGDITAGLDAAWNCRHKAVHSDAFLPLSILKSFIDAEHEIATILRAMGRAYVVFVDGGVKLSPPTGKEEKAKVISESKKKYTFENVDRVKLGALLQYDGYPVAVQGERRKNEWEIITQPELTVIAPRDYINRIIVHGEKADIFCEKYKSNLIGNPTTTTNARIGVDESGKGDIFGPLVVAGVVITPETELLLARQGVKDSKELSDSVIFDLVPVIRENCPVEVLVLLPPEYNTLYEQHGNLNRLLAWGHAQIITKLSKKETVAKAISDQFGDESLLINALNQEGCVISLVQKPHAESDIAVAAASVVARAEFVRSMKDYTAKAGFDIPFGASATQVKEIGKQIYRRWGKQGLERIAKMHFKTIQEIMMETK